MKRRLFATLMCVCLLIGLMPTIAFADDEGTEGTVQSVTEVMITEADMQNADESSTAIAEAINRLQITDLELITALKVTTGEGAYLSPSDNEYIKSNFLALEYLDESDCQCATKTLAESYLTKSELPNREYTEFGGLSDFTSLKTLLIPETAEVINSYSVDNTGLTSLTIPDGVLLFENGAFSSNLSLTGDIVIPDSVVMIGNNAFGAGSSNLNCGTLSLGNSVKYIDNSAFIRRIFTGNLVIPDSVEYIGKWVFTTPAFENGYWSIGSGLTYVGDASMSNICSGNTGTLFIPAKLQTADTCFGYNTFSKVEFEEGTTVIAARTVRDSTSITEVILPSTLQTIGTGAFSSCSSLTKVELPDGLVSINGSAFLSTALPSVYIPESVTTVGTRAFDNLPQDSVIYVQDDALIELLNEKQNDQWSRRYDQEKTALAVTNGGAFEPDAPFVTGSLIAPQKDNAIFEGWYEDSDFSGEPVTEVTAGNIYYAKWLDLGITDVSMQYQQTQNIAAPEGVTYSNWSSDDTSVAVVEEGNIIATGVGETTITAVAHKAGVGTATVRMNVSVAPLNITFGTGTGENPGGVIHYQYNGGQAPDFARFAKFYPADISGGSVTPVAGSSPVALTEGEDIVFRYDAGGGYNNYAYLPINVTAHSGTETGLPVTVKLLNENYRFVTNSNLEPSGELSLSVAVTDESLTESSIQGLPQGTLSFVYDGTGKAPVTGLTGISADNISEFTVHFHPWGNTEFAEQHLDGTPDALTDEALEAIAPTEPGSYLMIISGVSNDHYTYRSWIYTINKASVTITADSKTIYAGAAMPEFTYTVSGLAEGDALRGSVSYTCTANGTATAGTYAIIPQGAAVPDTEHYESQIEYVNGTLTILSVSGNDSDSSSSGSSGSSSDGEYMISTELVSGGKVTVNPGWADPGDTVTITVKPDSGYELSELTVTDSKGNEMKLSTTDGSKYTFTMPNSRVDIHVSFAVSAQPQTNPFTDVSTSDYYYDAVLWAVENGVTSGVSATTFGPNVTVTRAQMMTFLWRAHGSPKATGSNPFTDVSTSDYYYDAVLWAVKSGITSGVSATTFGSDNAVTRAQAVTFQWRAAGSPAVSSSSFGDVSADAYYAQAVAWAVANGITGGTGDNQFSPNMSVSRAQAVTFLWRELA